MGHTSSASTLPLSSTISHLLEEYTLTTTYCTPTNNSVKIYQHKKQPSMKICENVIEMGQDQLEQVYLYYSRRNQASHKSIVKVYYSDVFDRSKQQIYHYEPMQPTKKTNVNSICTLNIFQNQNHNASHRHVLRLFYEHLPSNYQQQITIRNQNQQIFSELQICQFIQDCASAADHLVANGFKEPILSPHAIKIDQQGQVRVGEWEFTQILHRQKPHSNSFEEDGEMLLRQKSSQVSLLYNQHSEESSNAWLNYYWPPEGIKSVQQTIQIGKTHILTEKISHKKSVGGQIFSLGMTVLQMILMRDLYQEATFSEKQLEKLVEEAQRARDQMKVPLSVKLWKLIKKMIRWDSNERINYQQLYQSVKHSLKSHQDSATEDTETNLEHSHSQLIKDQQSTYAQKQVDPDGTGSIHQGQGDIHCPFEDLSSETHRGKQKLKIDYESVDYTIVKQNKAFWKKCDGTVKRSNERTNRKYYEVQGGRAKIQFALEAMHTDGEDICNEEELRVKMCFSQEIQTTDEFENYANISENNCSHIDPQDHTHLFDLSKINQSLNSQHHSQTSFQKFIRSNQFQKDNSNLLTIQKDQFETENNELFTNPCLLAEIRDSANRLRMYSSLHKNLRNGSVGQNSRIEKENSDLNSSVGKYEEKSKPEQNVMSDSMREHNSDGNEIFVKEEFPKGYYEGAKAKGMRNGYGTFYYNKGGKYCGDWLNNQMHGHGTLYYDDGRIAYQGQWNHDSLHGRGILYNQDPHLSQQPYDFRNFDSAESIWVSYSGQFCNDDKSGEGLLILTNGEKYEGHFQNDAIEGTGIFYTMNHTKIEGLWQANQLVQVSGSKRKLY